MPRSRLVLSLIVIFGVLEGYAVALELVPTSPPEPACGRACGLALGASAAWVASGASLVMARQSRATALASEDEDEYSRLSALNRSSVVGGAVLGGVALGLGVWAVFEVRW